MFLRGLCPGNTSIMSSSCLRASVAFLTALRTVAFPKCSTSPISYKKLRLQKNVARCTTFALMRAHVHGVSDLICVAGKCCWGKWLSLMKNSTVQTDIHWGMAAHLNMVWRSSPGVRHCINCASMSIRFQPMSVWKLASGSAVGRRQGELRVSYRKPDSEQVRFTESVDMVIDSEFYLPLFLELKTQSFPHFRGNILRVFT